ncbi:hypothetical protein KVR01_008557 [Diaporthe batatas]|uniref:uncharacterized protein n=1 Tax=Diaporthe batatas TaxID=748121 RepID=UPI001D03B434|nr:uncharacterized protein KVR01_008557 [Diaporthe batatas]KAG8161570.1 hypothetical protein KVR01_008557 [Diaporthe batatas]
MYPPKSPGSIPRPAKGQRRTRWGPESQVAALNGLKTAITTAMTPEQLEAYATHFRIEEIGQKMQGGGGGPAPPPSSDSKRPPSPAPKYDASGRRTNTRQHRYRQGLEAERRALVGAALDTIPGYQRPRDLLHCSLKRDPVVTTKVYIPVRDFPGINFIGQILGPRGQSLAAMSEESGAHVAIRGKGSVKEGRAGGHHHHHPRGHGTNNNNDQQEPLHCLIRADTQAEADHARRLIDEVIEAAACSPEDQNRRKRAQLRQLAVMNGTFRDDEGRACDNCGRPGHRRSLCTAPARFVAGVTCRACNGAGHVARDCPRRGGAGAKLPPWRVGRLARDQQAEAGGAGPDAEFEQLMLELGG